jgi:hypothetical protein
MAAYPARPAGPAAHEASSAVDDRTSRALTDVDRILAELVSAMSELSGEWRAVTERVDELQQLRAALLREMARAGAARDESADERDSAATGRDIRANARDAFRGAHVPGPEHAAREQAASDRAAAREDRLAAGEDRDEARRDREPFGED